MELQTCLGYTTVHVTHGRRRPVRLAERVEGTAPKRPRESGVVVMGADGYICCDVHDAIDTPDARAGPRVPALDTGSTPASLMSCTLPTPMLCARTTGIISETRHLGSPLAADSATGGYDITGSVLAQADDTAPSRENSGLSMATLLAPTTTTRSSSD